MDRRVLGQDVATIIFQAASQASCTIDAICQICDGVRHSGMGCAGMRTVHDVLSFWFIELE